MGRIVKNLAYPGVYDVFNKLGHKLGHVERFTGSVGWIFMQSAGVGKHFIRQNLIAVAVALELRHGEHFSVPRITIPPGG
jgi:hypothetical protein